MDPYKGSLALPLLCTAIMGIGIQRGSTCVVAAVEDAVLARRFGRLGALLEAAAWATGILLLAHLAFGIEQFPAGFAGTWLTPLGGALLGLGAFLNGACAMGTIAGIANGDGSYLFTLLGMLGGYACQRLVAGTWTTSDPHAPYLLAYELPLVIGLGILVCWRLGKAHRMLRGHPTWRRAVREAWAPHAAVSVTTVAFALGAIAFQPWTYTDLLRDAALGMGVWLRERTLLSAALFGGALLAGVTMARWRPTPPQLLPAIRCASGGALMAVGSMLIPGQNDGRLLIGMPMLRPHAWVASASMLLTIACLIAVAHRAKRR